MGIRGSARRSRWHPRAGPRSVRCRHHRGIHVAQRQHGPARPLRPADGPDFQPRPCLEQPAGARRLHARRHPQGMGGVLVVLVRPGPAGGAQGARAARTSGASGCPCRLRRPTPTTSSSQFQLAYGAPWLGLDRRPQFDDPEIRAGIIKALSAYTADLAQGLHAARLGELGQHRQQQGVPRPDRRDDAERVALDPERAASTSGPTTITGTPRPSTGRMAPTASRWSSTVSSIAPWSSRTAATLRSPATSSASSPRTAGLPIG